jgi:PTS system nitrogen regulatory IIA component
MELADLITPERVVCDVEAQSKKKSLEIVSELIADADDSISSLDVSESLRARERLGGTGVGHGVAIPHGRLKSTRHTLGAFIRLKQGVDFDSADHKPVDLIFALLVPEESTDEHLKVLAKLASLFSDETFREKLRTASTSQMIYQLLVDGSKIK